MKLNNKGFAISSIMYIILVLAVILIALTLAIFSSRKLILDKQKNDALHEIYQTRYKNGDVVYFDVAKGVGCIEEDYDVTNSNTGYNGFNNKTSITDTTLIDKLETQNSCLKFYTFNDNGGDTVNLLLDHNTTAKVYWDTTEDNTDGPKELIEQLKIDVNDWKGTIIPFNYSVSQTNGGNYTIKYNENNYKARIITAGEIAQITGNQTFDESTAASGFYLDTNGTVSETCTSGDTSGCQYGWLYDRSSTNCTDYGCLNNSDIQVYGYWLSTSTKGSIKVAFYMDRNAHLNTGTISGNAFGVRPVITVLRENLL